MKYLKQINHLVEVHVDNAYPAQNNDNLILIITLFVIIIGLISLTIYLIIILKEKNNQIKLLKQKNEKIINFLKNNKRKNN